jgi:hypothetical protein
MLKMPSLLGRPKRPGAGSPNKMNYWDAKWDLQVECCPCDVHFNDWVADRQLKNQLIYHLGSGAHHVVGFEQATNGLGNTVFCVTASIGEYDAYIDLVAGNARVSRAYLCYFGDIYLSNPVLLPEFDVVTLFHLCEFFFPNTTGADYGGLDDRGVLDLFTDKTRIGGHILFYMGSNAFHKAEPIIAAWEAERKVERVGEFKTLLVYRRTG